jgi:hypothetical protein
VRQIGAELAQDAAKALQDEIALAAIARPAKRRVAGRARVGIFASGEIERLVPGEENPGPPLTA